MADRDTSQQAMTMKAKGNTLFRDGKYLESIVEYTAAVELDRFNPVLYSNRSLAFLKLGQHFYALKDAENAIRMNREWSKGYYRKGQVEESAEQYESAKVSYKKGLHVNPNDDGLRRAVIELKKKEALATKKERLQTRKYILFCAIFSSVAVAIDMNLQGNFFVNQIFRWVFVSSAVVVGIFVSRFKSAWQGSSKRRMLRPPPDLLSELGKDEMYSKNTETSAESEVTSTDQPEFPVSEE